MYVIYLGYIAVIQTFSNELTCTTQLAIDCKFAIDDNIIQKNDIINTPCE